MDGAIFTKDPDISKALVSIRAISAGDVDGIDFYDGLSLSSSGGPCEQEASDCAVIYIASLGVGTHILTAVATDSTGKSCT